ncbi:hypothetical protein PRIPAC_75417 [Pristionchus pacificus]|uniref:Uncharacterized protein n=1 Tax=Pristionchus pacificus TaxID=54126 RepID=A0A2A6D098_PRIPA|nr:hypothetical protein PRIPAC_75417 [Pristionchus pacificus]|eukprot:PDM83798.1 hypothetical protein PRIPAC_30285 [Pristionchus pacificus]
MAYSLTNFLITFFAFNVAILTWVFRTSTDPLTTALQLTLPLMVWEALLFASFAPDGLLDLFLPELHNDDNYRFVASTVAQPPGPHGDCWSDEPTEYNRADDLTEMNLSSDSSDSDGGMVYMRPIRA